MELWDTIKKTIQMKYDIQIDREILDSMPWIPLVFRITEIMKIYLNKDLRKLDFESEELFSPKMFSIDVCETIAEVVFNPCLDYLMKISDNYFNKSKRSTWYIKTGESGIIANGLLQKAVYSAENIYGEHSLKTIPYLLNLAKSSFDIHCEQGRPEGSLWNKCKGVNEDKYSAESRFFYNKVINTYRKNKILYHKDMIDCYEGLAC